MRTTINIRDDLMGEYIEKNPLKTWSPLVVKSISI